MKYCENCRHLFLNSESDGACPYCGTSDDLTDAAECAHCHGEFPPDEVNGGLCPDCRAEAQRQYSAFWDSFSTAFQDYVLDTDYHPAG